MSSSTGTGGKMDKAKAALASFTSKSGHHETTVHTNTAPAVEHEVVKPVQHEEILTAVDKEVHQDHYHDTVQPIQDQVVRPEQHHHNLGAVKHREVDHRDTEATKARLAAESAKYRDTREVVDTAHTQSRAPTVEGEHVHHHIHETIHPEIHKEVIEPHVVHTTVPIHETHHEAAQHHKTTVLPPVNMSEFKQSGGIMGGKAERFENFEGTPETVGGVPKAIERGYQSSKGPIDGKFGTFHGDLDDEHNHVSTAARGVSGTTGSTSEYSTTGGRTAGSYEQDVAGKLSSHSGSNVPRTGAIGSTSSGVGHSSSHSSTTESTNTKKSGGILDKLNPMTDSNGDGKPGFLK